MEPLQCGGRGLHRRSLSAPSLECMADAALQHYQTTPCSVLDLHALKDEVSLSLRRTLRKAQQELLAAMEAGVLNGAAGGGHDGGGSGGSGGCRHYASDSPEGPSDDGDERPRWRSSGGGGGSGGGGWPAQYGGLDADGDGDGDGEGAGDLEAELAGLPAREREAALKRAKNREAARRSRERKVERISGLQQDVDALRSNNFVLLRCIEEVATKALAARAEQQQLQDELSKKLAAVQRQPEPAAAAAAAAGAAAGACASAPSPAVACTPPAAKRAAALEQELLRLEAGHCSPTQLLLPRWPDHADVAPAGVTTLPRQQLPTSAELRRQLREAVTGACSGSDGCAAPAAAAADARQAGQGQASAADHHLLHPSPPMVAGRKAHPWEQQHPQEQQQDREQQEQQQWVALEQKPGGSLLRTCSAPGTLLVGGGSDAGLEDVQAWFRGVAA